MCEFSVPIIEIESILIGGVIERSFDSTTREVEILIPIPIGVKEKRAHRLGRKI